MRVALTGGTGFVGSHTTARLLEHGHVPRLLVRDPAKAERVLGPLGVAPESIEVVVGDMEDEEAVGHLLDGADACIHGAATIGVTGPRSDLVARNGRGMELVVGQAVARGLDPVVHISTIAIFVPPDRSPITPANRLGSPRTDYGRSKVAAERYARRLQEDGAPVTIVYPGGVIGPGQPTLDAMMEGLAGAIGQAFPVPVGGVCLLHVDDLAEGLARMVVPGQGPRQFMLGGDFLRWPDFADLCERLTGEKLRRFKLPARAFVALGRVLDVA
jgi:nucleoside-diphosphate-sugar epimerase